MLHANLPDASFRYLDTRYLGAALLLHGTALRCDVIRVPRYGNVLNLVYVVDHAVDYDVRRRILYILCVYG